MQHFKDLLKNKQFLFILVFTILSMTVIDASGTYAGNHLISTLKGDNSLISWLTFIQVLPEFLFLMIAVKFFNKWGFKKFYLFAVISNTIRMACYGFVPSTVIFIVVSLVHCFMVACQTVGNLSFLKQSVHPAVFGTAITLMNASLSIGKAIYGYIFGYVYETFGSFAIFQVGLVFMILSVILVFKTKYFNHIEKA